MGAKIIDRGRGPEIAGTRITVYDVLDYLQAGWRCEHIAGLFRLPPDEIKLRSNTLRTIETRSW